MIYTIDDLYQSVNDVYAQYDGGKITYVEAEEILANVCNQFVSQFREAL